MDVAELASKLPWLLGIVAVVWLLRRWTRPQTLHDLPVHAPPPAPPIAEPAEVAAVEETDADLDEDAEGEAEDVAADESEEDAEGLEEELDEEEDDEPAVPFAPSRGLGGIVAGIVIVAIGAGVLFLAAPRFEGDPRHIAYLVGMVVLLVGSGFVRRGLQRFVLFRRRRAREFTAAEPWLRDRDWSRDGAEPIAEEGLLPQFLALAFLGALVLPFHTIWTVDWSWWGFWVVIGILDLLIFAVLVVALRSLWFRVVGGAARLRWNGMPVAPGETFRALVEVARIAPGDAPARVTLRCMRDGSPGGSTTDDPAPDASKVWSEDKEFPIRPLPGGGASVDVSFAIPPDAKGTDTRRALPIRWQLVVAIPTAGPDFETIFPVPIYARV